VKITAYAIMTPMATGTDGLIRGAAAVDRGSVVELYHVSPVVEW
jgi:hypothetical protein